MNQAFERAIVTAMRSIDWTKEGGAVHVIFLSKTEFQVFSEGNVPTNYEVPLDAVYNDGDHEHFQATRETL